MKTLSLLAIAGFLVLLPWFQGLNFEMNEVMIDGVTISAITVMTITLVFSVLSWGLIAWATKSMSVHGILLGIISGASLVIPFLQVLGPMAGVILGVVAGFVAFMLQKSITAKNRPVLIAAVTLASTYIALAGIVLASQSSVSWESGNDIDSWTGTAEELEESGFDNVFNNNIGFVFFLAIIPSLIMTEWIVRIKK